MPYFDDLDGPLIRCHLLFLRMVTMVQIGPAIYMNADKFAYIMRSTSDARCVLGVSRHLWVEEEAAQRSLTGKPPRTISGASGKCVATPEKVDIVKNFLAKYIEDHPLPGGPPAEHRLRQVRKHLRSYFTESSRWGKRGTQKKIKPMNATDLTTCISPDFDDCRVFFYMTPTKSNAVNNFQAATNLRYCLKDALRTCSGCDKEYLGDYIDSIAEALTYLYWDYSSPALSAAPTLETTFGTTTQESVSPTHEASSTTAKSEKPTKRCGPTVTTEGSEQSSEVPTTTGKPEPTTPAPSSAFTNLPELSVLSLAVVILMVWSA